MNSICVFGAATALLISSAAFAAPGPGSGIPHETRRAGDHVNIIADNQELMCKVANPQQVPDGKGFRGVNWHEIGANLIRGGEISCTGRVPARL